MSALRERKSTVKRTTKETDITLTLSLDGSGRAKADTGIGFLDHMLDSFARHGFFDLEAVCKGDLYVDGHHTAEDVGIVLGEALRTALGDKQGIRRYGSFILPMDESLVLCALDLSGRPYFDMQLTFDTERVGGLDTELVAEFFHAVSYSCGMNLHIRKLAGGNSHHLIEAAFKAFAKALDEAVSIDSRIQGILSTKGSL